ncbi:hypothetical protein FP435_03715 [Lactobacillus sp. PV037]|uniref:hypothetical protein n=1 Tax=unclassified Lactobacillus TaxID=2620435 RepID=UPI00223FAABA|nr:MULTISPECIES: hypothetical protein [unclassified Lactobacillus]QNQ82275.1 hypothetical protein FP433_04115 [Lactobacillus sp. PV012]QNQ83614.1 hypothetical protein FP435_03715 [Lactobacillus sp. PV037]
MKNRKKDSSASTVFYLKYVKPRYTKDIIKGKFYFTKVRYFKDLGLNGDNNIGDLNEGHITKKSLPGEWKTIKLNGESFDITDCEVTLNRQILSDEQYNEIGIFSLIAVTTDDLVFVEENENGRKFKLKKEFIEDCKKIDPDNQRDLVAIPKNCFYNFKKEQQGYIKYYNSTYSKSLPTLSKDNWTTLFYKDKSYEFQHEYRLIKSINNGNYLEIVSGLPKIILVKDIEKIEVIRKKQFNC